MFIKIDPSSPIPIYIQIINQLKYAIAIGEYKPDEPIPSVRNLAVEVKINPNTVVKAYTELERENIIYTKRGIGYFVSPNGDKLCKEITKKMIQAKIINIIKEAIQSGIEISQLKKIFDEQVKKIRR